MNRLPNSLSVTRRRFAFWVGLGLFNLSEALGAESLDRLAAATMRATEPKAEPTGETAATTTPEHWTAAENNTWVWFERENLVDGHWKLSGITTPVHKRTGERYEGREGYLSDELVPEKIRRNAEAGHGTVSDDTAVEDDAGVASSSRRARHGRPPSRWLRRLYASELRTWLKTIDPPEAGVEGMTYWEHLTRDHSFEPRRIAGLNENEQAKLHAAAHYGY